MAKEKSQNSKLRNFQLDTSSKYYPIFARKKSISVYCFGVIMNEKVDPILLKQAANEIIKQFPSMAVALKTGFAWHYLKENINEVKVFEHDSSVLKPVDPSETNGYQFKISYEDNKIEIVFFHGLTDGTGAMAFLQALVVHYQELKGVHFDDNKNFGFTVGVDFDDIEDSFKKYYKPISLADADLIEAAGVKPNKIIGTPVEAGNAFSSVFYVDSNQIRAKAKENEASITGYLSGLLAYTIEKISKSDRPIVMMIPVNLRTVFPSKTMKNFVTFIRLHFKPNTCSNISNCIKEATKQLKEKVDKNKLEKMISTMVKSQMNFIMKYSPLFIKKICLKIGKFLLKSRQTIIFSNMGNVTLPKEMGVESYVFQMNVSSNNPQNLGVVTVNGKTMFTFTSVIKETTLIDEFKNVLESESIKIEK